MECTFCENKDEFEEVTSRGDKFTIEKSWMCMNCGLVFLHPRVSNTEYYLSDEFSKDFRGTDQPNRERREINHENAKMRWGVAEKFLPPAGSLLEIGCSSGEFLLAAESKFNTWGIDPSLGFVNNQVSERAIVEAGAFPEFDFSDSVGRFDVIATFHTLEHVENPVEFLQRVYDRLGDNGVFLLEYPDLSRAVEGRNQIFSSYFQKSHLHDFSLFNLVPVLKGIGLIPFQLALYDGYPKDKNVMIVCRKGEPESSEAERAAQPEAAQQLLGELRERMSDVIAPTTLGKKQLKIIHIASHHINMGDGAIIAGIQSTIEGMIDSPVVFVNVDIVDYTYFGTDFAAAIFDDIGADLILVGGGGTIDGHKFRTQSGTAFSMNIEEIEKLKTPIGFVGLGHNLFHAQEFHNEDRLIEFLEYCKGSNTPFSVRLDGSWERLAEFVPLELAAYIDRVPDPGFFVPLRDAPSPCFSPAIKKHVVLQVALDAYSHRLHGVAGDDVEQKANEFLNQMGRYVEFLIKKMDADVTLAEHTMDDTLTTGVLLNRLPNDATVRRMNLRTTGVHHPIYAPTFFNTYAQADLVVGMRGHSVICGAGLGTPTLAISTHNKIAGFCNEAGLSPWCIELGQGDLPEQLESATEALLTDSEYQLAQVEMMTKTWRKQLSTFLVRCLEQIK